MKRRLNLILLGSFLLVGATTLVAETKEKSATSSQLPRLLATDKPGRLRLMLNANYVIFSKDGASISALGAGGDAQYAFTPKWGMGGGLRQGFTSSGFSALFTEIHINGAYAITGDLFVHREHVSLGDTEVVRTESAPVASWIARFYVSQYFVNGPGSTLPYSSLGIGTSYDFYAFTESSLAGGIRIDRMTNGVSSFYPISFYLSWEFPTP